MSENIDYGNFLVEKLGISWSKVHFLQSTGHVNSEELVEKLDYFLGHPDIDPHGDPIPKKNGTIATLNQVLSELNVEEE